MNPPIREDLLVFAHAVHVVKQHYLGNGKQKSYPNPLIPYTQAIVECVCRVVNHATLWAESDNSVGRITS